MIHIGIALALLFLPSQDAPAPNPPPRVDSAKVEEAIRKGTAYLKSAIPPDGFPPEERYGAILQEDELVLWTLVHAGVPESDPDFQRLFKEMIERELAGTYVVALQAMILEEIDRVKYQPRIWQCAQFLVDNHCLTGQWTYGAPTTYKNLPPGTPTGTPRKAIASAGGKASTGDLPPPGVKVKPRVLRKIPVTQQRKGPKKGDNSNSQYAALGLRACHDAGILLPKDVIDLAIKWWRDSQHESPESAKEAYPAEGWGYKSDEMGEPYGSMTAGAVGSLVIYDYILDEKASWKKDKDVQEGIRWLTKYFTVTENPQRIEPDKNYYYYLYGLERAGILYGTEKFGEHEWYPEGADVLLKAQNEKGAWKGVADTCFAILFLRRATRPLMDVASVDGASRRR